MSIDRYGERSQRTSPLGVDYFHLSSSFSNIAYATLSNIEQDIQKHCCYVRLRWKNET